MNITTSVLAPFALVATAALASAQVGQPLPAPGLTDFSGTTATSFDDYTGRLVLIEFFAFW